MDKLNLNWFPHATDAYAHPKFKMLRMRYGWGAEAKFWALNSIIASQDGCVLLLKENRNRLFVMAELEISDGKEFDEYISFLASNDCQLLIEKDGGFTTEMVQESLEKAYHNKLTEREKYKKRQAKKAQKNEIPPGKTPFPQGKVDFPEGKPDFPSVNDTHNTTVHNSTIIDTNVSIGDTNVSPPLEPDEYSILKSEYEKVPKEKIPIYQFLKTGKAQAVGLLEPYVDLWNIFAEENGKPGIKALNKKRKGHLLARLKDHYPGKKGEPKVFCFDFAQVLKKAKESEFLMTENNWFGFDWLIKNDTNYMKVLEGNYANKPKETEPPKESIYDRLMKPAGSPTVGQA